MRKESPKFSMVTPSYNQAPYLEQAMRSILDQEYPNLEYIVQDGGSKDGSRDIIERYAPRLHAWTSEKDAGQYDAINKGFAKSSGELMGWLNSDDMHLPWTLSVVSEIFIQFPEIQWLTTRFPMLWRPDGSPAGCGYDRDGADRKNYLLGTHCPGLGRFSRSFIQQESTFWRRSLWEKTGGFVDASLRYASDFDLWTRFIKEAEPYYVQSPLAGFRIHPDQKTGLDWEGYCKEAFECLKLRGGRKMNAFQSGTRLVGQVLDRRVSVRLGLLKPIHVVEPTERKDSWRIVVR